MKLFHKIKQSLYHLLKRSEKYTKTDMVYLMKGGFWTTGGQIIAILAGLGTAVAFANLVPQSVYGTYKFLIAAAGIISAFSLSGLSASLTRSVARGYQGALREGFFASLRSSIPMIVIALGTGAYYYLHGNTTLAIGMLAIALFQPLRQASGLLLAYFVGQKNFRMKMLVSASGEILAAIVLIALMLIYPHSPALFFWLFLAVHVLVVLIAFSLFLRKNGKSLREAESEPGMVRYGMHLSLMNGITKVGKNIDQILIFHFLGAVELALYSFALLPANRSRGLLGSAQQLILPKFSNRDIKTLKQTIARKALTLFIFGALGALILALIIPTVFAVIIPKYTGATLYAQVFTLSLLFLPSMLYEQALTAHARSRELYIVRVASNAVKIGFLLVLLPLYGLWGAVFAFLAFFASKFLVSAVCFYRIKTS